MTTLFKVQNGSLIPAQRKPLSRETLIQDWVEKDPQLLGLDAILLGREVQTAHGNKIDLLAMDADGGLVIIELKKSRTPREIVAQLLDYASWVRTLTTPDVYALVEKYRPNDKLTLLYQNHFQERLPEQLNTSHSMLIVASELDPASKRIVEYLSEEYKVAINTAFFNVFESDGQEWVTTDFLLEQAEVEERSEQRIRPPWSGYYFVNVGDGPSRSWEDMRRYGFVAAGGGEFYSKRLDQLSEGDQVFAYQKGCGYVGFGVVTSKKVPVTQFETPGGLLIDQPLKEPNLKHDADNPVTAEYAVGVDWKRTLPFSEAKRFPGAFANQNIVCKLRDPATVDFLVQEFGLST
ncbi:endonuclease NucS [Asticcacaulis sp. ZE23SCel15]|uniref:endonuclease NucS domain-containing protein n=1 Tax=Asticcacaulis sp. ZE23SCel15 TaxID=3059027 RepID=UPI00265DACD2|nr:endonuclease NucS domain-containing protein [Asticcacaulis sp. ZE23SCel15]WKL58002.1 endonuclease NucS [Asticcacaulis sp. ZE23SCel15]